MAYEAVTDMRHVIAAMVALLLGGAVPAVAQGVTDGHYVGIGYSLNRGAAFCPQRLNAREFRGAGGELRGGNFRGRIAADRSVQIPFRSAWLTGRFEGTDFRGEVDQGRLKRNESCRYVMDLKLAPR